MSHWVQRNVPVPATLPDVQAFMYCLLEWAAHAGDLYDGLLDPRSVSVSRIRIPGLGRRHSGGSVNTN